MNDLWRSTNKSERQKDACALLEAARCADIVPVRIKSVEQQALQCLHRIRSLWMSTRTSRINALRGFCREFGLVVPIGARPGVEVMSRTLADPNSPVPILFRGSMKLLIEEIGPVTATNFLDRISDSIGSSQRAAES